MPEHVKRIHCQPNFLRRSGRVNLLMAVAVLCASQGARAGNAPVAVTGWNTDIIADNSASNLLSTLSSNTNSSGGFLSYTANQAFYAQGINAAYPGGTIHSSATTNLGVATNTTFQLQNFNSNNALLVGPGSGFANSGTVTFANPSAFSSVSFLIAAFDSSGNPSSAGLGIVANFDPASGGGSSSVNYPLTRYWDNSAASSYYGTATTDLGRINVSNGTISNTSSGATGTYLYELNLKAGSIFQGNQLLDSFTFSQTQPVPYAILAVSGTPVSITYPITWKGSVSSAWNTTTANWYNTSAGVNSAGVNYTDNAAVTFDDTATGSTNITIASGGVQPQAVNFNNSSAIYNFTGGAIAGSTSLNLTGSGTVILNNTNTFIGSVNIKAGKLVLGSSGALTSAYQFVNVSPGATLELHGNSNLTATTEVFDYGTVNVIGANVTGILMDTGTINIDSASTFTTYAGFDGTAAGAGTLILVNSINSLGTPVAGTMTIETPNSLLCNVQVSGGATIVIGDSQAAQNNITAGLNGSSPVLLTLAGTGNLANKAGLPNGALLGADYSQDVWAGNVNLSASAYISGGYSGSLTISGVISGSASAAVGFSSDSSATTILANVNTYTGETQIVTQNGGTALLQLAVPNAINSSSGLNFVGGQAGQLDLNGNPVSFAYLTGNSSSYLITNTASTLATLTVVQKAGTSTFAGQITDGNGQVALKFTGTGNQTLTGSNTYSGGTTVNSGTVTAAALASLGTGIITVNGGGIIFSNTSLSTIFPLIQSGYNGGGWNGSSGINSSAAAADPKHLHAVGMYQPASATTFEGQPLGSGDVAVKYTYYGDANLDGTVSSADYTLIDAGFLSHGGLTGWQNGDFNYDGVINGSDYTLIDNAFNTQGAAIAASVANPTAVPTDQISQTSSVPEPDVLGLFAISAASLLGRRRDFRILNTKSSARLRGVSRSSYFKPTAERGSLKE
jgi:autotransporter-associated beta strand protein